MGVNSPVSNTGTIRFFEWDIECYRVKNILRVSQAACLEKVADTIGLWKLDLVRGLGVWLWDSGKTNSYWKGAVFMLLPILLVVALLVLSVGQIVWASKHHNRRQLRNGLWRLVGMVIVALMLAMGHLAAKFLG